MDPRDNPYAMPKSDLGSGIATVPADGLPPADTGKRFVAYMIDGLALAAVAGVAMGAFVVLAMTVLPKDNQELLINLLSLVFQFGLLVAYALYGALMESSGWQATLGKRAMGIMVVDERGAPLTFGKALGRNVAKWLLMGICGLLAITPLVDARKRGVWDQVAKTRVVPRGYEPL